MQVESDVVVCGGLGQLGRPCLVAVMWFLYPASCLGQPAQLEPPAKHKPKTANRTKQRRCYAYGESSAF